MSDDVRDWSIIQAWDPERNRWKAWELLGEDPNHRIRQILGGNPTRREGDLEADRALACWNERNGRKLFVLNLGRRSRADAVRVMRAQ